MKAQNSSPSLRSLWLSSPPHSTGMEGVLLLGLQCLLPRDQDGSLEADFRGTKKACVLGHALDAWHKHLPSRSVASPPRWLLRAKIKVCTKSPFAVCNGQDNFSWLSFWYWHYYGLFKNTHFVSSDSGSCKECIMTLACMCSKHFDYIHLPLSGPFSFSLPPPSAFLSVSQAPFLLLSRSHIGDKTGNVGLYENDSMFPCK